MKYRRIIMHLNPAKLRCRIRFAAALTFSVLTANLLWPAPLHASGDFGLIDHRGDFHQISRYANSGAVIILPYQIGDTESEQAALTLQRMAAQMQDDVVVLLLNASDERAAVLVHVNAVSIDLPVLLDGSQTVARTLGVDTLGEAFILNPGNQRLVFRGPLPELEGALQTVLSGQAPPPAANTVTGTSLHYRFLDAFSDREISYELEIAPLLQARCAYCHIEDGLAPWPMNRHLMVLGWSPMIRETLITRRMPPGQIDPHVGNWRETQNLSDADMAMLIAWIDRGAPRDGSEDPLTQPTPETGEWPLGTPDLIVELPEEVLPATGIVDFRLKRVALNLPADKWLRAISYSVGDKTVLHSLLVYALKSDVEPATAEALIAADNADFLSVYVPGETGDVFRPDSAYLLHSERDLVVKLRYLTSGRATVDHTRIGLYFRDTPPAMRLHSLMLDNTGISIPPDSRDHVEVLETPAASSDYYLESYSPHAHNRGKRMRLTAIYPDGSEELLINVANYNFNWQLAYTLPERKHLPAGTRLRAETIYDNSDANPFNPDASLEISSGTSTWDEMFSHLLRIAVPYSAP